MFQGQEECYLARFIIHCNHDGISLDLIKLEQAQFSYANA